MPEYRRLRDEVLRGRLLTVRQSVEPILGTNLLRSFTDHSVRHSDQVCAIIDDLTEPMAGKGLSDIEAFILYAAAYLHDVGMQHDKCDETRVMARVIAESPYRGRRWADLDEHTRWDLVRRHHHEISSEMIRGCIDAPQPTVLGVQLTQRDYPAYIAAVSEAHCVDPASERYKDLTDDGPNIRTSLLAALLRLADILDESQRRAQLYRERTVRLDLESQMHWWRHYYVAQVTFHPVDKRVTMWFDFPPDRREVYRPIVPELQRPWIESELLFHRAVLLANGVGWHLEIAEVRPLHSSSLPMPDNVLLRMYEELHRRRRRLAMDTRLAALHQLEGAQSLLVRRLDEIASSTEPPVDKVRRALDLAEQLRSLGGAHGASMVFYQIFQRHQSQLATKDAINFGRRLGAILLDDRKERLAAEVLATLGALAKTLPRGDSLRMEFDVTWCRALLANADIDEARKLVTELRSAGPTSDLLEELEAELDEAALIRGHASLDSEGASA